ncbi:MAG: hypothetical protein E7679_04815 [Ruminococcaceae bacterium]|nr:hypothetical protein [Oscillospiraceae bacterium]
MAEKEMKIDKVTGEVFNEKKTADEKKQNSMLETLDFDPYADRRNNDDLNVTTEGESVVYKVPVLVRRFSNAKKEDRAYYNYAVGYKTVINGKTIAQTIDLEPAAKRADIYDLLDAIFGESESAPLEIVRTAMHRTQNGRTKTTYIYSFRVSATDEDNVEVSCGLEPTRGNADKKQNLIAKMKAVGAVE